MTRSFHLPNHTDDEHNLLMEVYRWLLETFDKNRWLISYSAKHSFAATVVCYDEEVAMMLVLRWGLQDE